MKNIITYCLWGDLPIYWNGAVENIKLAKKYYPDFICRFYIDINCKKELIDTIEGDNVEVILMNSENYKYSGNISDRFNHSGLFWRFLPLADKSINILLSRDCDSRISDREISAIKEWIESDKDFHIMRDHPYHQVPILSGMWGCRNGILSNINDILTEWINYKGKGRYQADDQDLLGQIIYPIVKNRSLEHSEFGISFGGEIRPFPTIRENYEFVGDVFDENEQRHPDYWRLIK
jgi:hypothetical protein